MTSERHEPAIGTPTKWKLSVLLNGVTAAPNLYNAPELDEYDLAQVRISSVVPPGGPVGQATTVTLHGTGFADYGVGQLRCRAGDMLLDGSLLDTSRVLCTLPAQASPLAINVGLSLNNGSIGTFSDAVKRRRHRKRIDHLLLTHLLSRLVTQFG